MTTKSKSEPRNFKVAKQPITLQSAFQSTAVDIALVLPTSRSLLMAIELFFRKGSRLKDTVFLYKCVGEEFIDETVTEFFSELFNANTFVGDGELVIVDSANMFAVDFDTVRGQGLIEQFLIVEAKRIGIAEEQTCYFYNDLSGIISDAEIDLRYKVRDHYPTMHKCLTVLAKYHGTEVSLEPPVAEKKAAKLTFKNPPAKSAKAKK